jgi:Hydrophobic surface binding protein A
MIFSCHHAYGSIDLAPLYKGDGGSSFPNFLSQPQPHNSDHLPTVLLCIIAQNIHSFKPKPKKSFKMKFTTAAAALALSGSAMAAGGADTVNAVLATIADDLKKFDTAINGWKGGDIGTLDSASKQIQGDIDAGVQKINSGDSLTLVDAAGITSNVQGLQTQLDATLGSLKSIGDKLASGGQCSNIQGQLKTQSVSAQGLQDAITGKAPPEAKQIAQQLGGKIGESLAQTQAYFDKTCAGAPSAGASSSSSGGASSGAAPAGGSSSGSSSSGAAPAGGAASGSGSSSSSPKPAQSGGHGHAKPATTSGVPKPATYTGAGSTVQVPFAVALALAVFAL